MRHQWLVYAIVVALGLGVGLAIVGLPSSQPLKPTIIVAATEPAVEPGPASTVADVTTTVSPETTVPPPTAPTTTAAVETTTTVEPAPVAPDRATVPVVVANGADIGGLASRTAELLEALGYVGVIATDGTDIVEVSVVYYVDDSELAAAQLAVDLSLDPAAIRPIAEAPDIRGSAPEVGLLAYLGVDSG